MRRFLAFMNRKPETLIEKLFIPPVFILIGVLIGFGGGGIVARWLGWW